MSGDVAPCDRPSCGRTVNRPWRFCSVACHVATLPAPDPEPISAERATVVEGMRARAAEHARLARTERWCARLIRAWSRDGESVRAARDRAELLDRRASQHDRMKTAWLDAAAELGVSDG